MKFYYEIAPIKIIRSNSDFFTYSSEDKLKAGTIVEIPVGKQKAIGVVWKEVAKPEFKTRDVLRIISENIPIRLLELSIWMSTFYATPLANVLSGILPTGISKKRRHSKMDEYRPSTTQKSRINFLYTKQQKEAIETLDDIKNGTILLHGVTGSGKTEVYINQAKKTIEIAKKSAIILVPEIALTSQLVANFSQEFSNIKIIHSRQTESEKHKIWTNILHDKEPQIIIGARSAIFAPVKDLGLIIVDECHEPSFRQDQTPKYSALRVASFLAKRPNTKAVFGSATPLVEDYFLAKLSEKNGGNPIIKLTKPAIDYAKPPKIKLIDLSQNKSQPHRFLSKQLLDEIKKTLSENKQALIYHNRRGSASVTECHNCGWQSLCDNCFLPMTLHNDNHILSCHVCGRSKKVPLSCPNCGEAEIIHKGIGTKIIETEIKKIFPEKRIMRFDADSDKSETVEKMYDQIRSGEIDIIIGTQVIAKGLDLPKLKTVAVIQADAGLSLPDFTSNERNFQLLAQVIGRVGRHSDETNVIIQTYRPEAKSIQLGISQNFDEFYTHEIENRRKQNYPPFVYLLKLTCIYKTEKSSTTNSYQAAQRIREKYQNKVQIFGPTPAFYERLGGAYRWQIIIKSKRRSDILEIAKEFQTLPHWRVDLDSSII